MTYELVNVFPHELFLQENEGPCISLYQPTHRTLRTREKDLIRYRNLLQEIEQSLSESYGQKEIASLMDPLRKIEMDRNFWQTVNDGLAIFVNEGKCIVYKLHRRVEAFSVVASSFHIKPLIRFHQSADRFLLLGINRKQFTLYEGTRYELNKLEFDEEIRDTFEKAIGEDYEQKMINATGSGPKNEISIHGQGSKKDVIRKETEKFFRIADEEIFKNYSQTMQLPVYLVALDEHHAMFQQVSKNKYLQKEGVRADYQAMDTDKLLEATWKVLEPIYIERTHALVERFKTAQSQDKGSDDIAQIARAASEGRIMTVLLESDRIYPGKVDMKSGELIDAQLDNPKVDDVLDDIAEIVYKQKGEVVVVPKERMPSSTGAAAIYRY